MATISLTVNPAAFKDDPGGEAARILREVADKLEKGKRRFVVKDNLGQVSGKIRATDIPGGRW